ncbi:MAG: caspase family protein [Kofleriaceae bacterium]
MDTNASSRAELVVHKGGRRRALLVGINDYPGFASDLPSCVADVEAMGDLLARQYGFELEVLVDGEATQDGVRAALGRLCADVQEADRVCFFYSGHGSTIPRRDSMEECLVLGDGTLFPDDDFVACFAQIPPGTALAILDSCFSGGMSKDAFGVQAKRIPMLDAQAQVGLRKGARYRPFGGKARAGFGAFSPHRKKALVGSDEAQDALLNALLISACLEGETAAASTPATNGLSSFTHALLTAIASQGAAMTCAQLVVETTEELRRIGAFQTPQVKEPPVPQMLADAEFPVLRPASKAAPPTGPRAQLATRGPRPAPIPPHVQLASAFLDALSGLRLGRSQ